MKMILAELRTMTRGSYLMSQIEYVVETRAVDSNTLIHQYTWATHWVLLDVFAVYHIFWKEIEQNAI